MLWRSETGGTHVEIGRSAFGFDILVGHGLVLGESCTDTIQAAARMAGIAMLGRGRVVAH